MKLLTFIVILSAALITVSLGFITMSTSLSLTALGFIAWAVSPYLYLAVLAKLVPRKLSIYATLILALLVAGFGISVIIDATFIHSDAQGGLIYIFVPLWQWAFLVIGTVPVYILNIMKN